MNIYWAIVISSMCFSLAIIIRGFINPQTIIDKRRSSLIAIQTIIEHNIDRIEERIKETHGQASDDYELVNQLKRILKLCDLVI